jgi:UDP-2,3-diacylglucosamine hydrolase
VAAQRAPAPALPLPEATPTLALPATGGRSISSATCISTRSTPGAFDAWAAHLRHSRADAVFILGDLFEVWVGDDIAERDFEARCTDVLGEAADTVRSASWRQPRLPRRRRASRIARRDAPARPDAAGRFGQQVLSRTATRSASATSRYQRYRRIVRRPRRAARPAGAAAAVAKRARPAGAQAERGATGVRRGVLRRRRRRRGARLLGASDGPSWSHGHTHAPASHGLGTGLVRHVLSDWHLDGSGPRRAEVLRWTDAGFARIAPEAAGAGEPR